jgi:hypothetical protein
METFKKRQKEMRRLEKQRDKAAKKKEIKARKAAGLPEISESENEVSEDTPESPAETNPPITD